MLKMDLNIICFHGFAQNSHILSKKLSNLVGSTKKINLVFMDGTVKLPIQEESNQNPLAYWIFDPANPLSIDWSNQYKTESVLHGLNDSIQSFIDLGQRLGRVDGVIGFSQGGCFADHICKLHANGKIPFNIKFAIFISAEKFDRPGLEYAYVNKPTVKSLHMIGAIDSIIPANLSEELSTYYDQPLFLKHKGAHVIPSNSEAKNVFKNFINQFH